MMVYRFSVVLYEMGDIIASDSDKILINGYRDFIERYHNNLPEIFNWLKSLTKPQLDRLKLKYHPLGDGYYENISIRMKRMGERGDDGMLIVRNSGDPHDIRYVTLRLLGRADII